MGNHNKRDGSALPNNTLYMYVASLLIKKVLTATCWACQEPSGGRGVYAICMCVVVCILTSNCGAFHATTHPRTMPPAGWHDELRRPSAVVLSMFVCCVLQPGLATIGMFKGKWGAGTSGRIPGCVISGRALLISFAYVRSPPI